MSSRGSVLLYVVFIVLLLSLFAAGVGSRALFALDLSQRLADQLQSLYLARAAAQIALVALSRDQSPAVDSLQDPWANNEELFGERRLAGGLVRVLAGKGEGAQPQYGLQDEERRINMNTAPEEVLQRVMERIGHLPEREASEVAASILDWRDPDTQEHSNGAEGQYYQSLHDGYECKDAPFENTEELLLVRGISPELYRRIEPWVTVYGSGRVNLNTASTPVLQALGLSESGVSGLRFFRAGEDNLEGTSDDRVLGSLASMESELSGYLPGAEVAMLQELARQEILTVRAEAFRMQIEASTDSASSRMRVVAITDRGGHLALWSAW